MKYRSNQQKNIVLDDSRIKLINGCAGSGKTDTIIKLGLKEIKQNKNVLFITLVSSVTEEIKKRLFKKLGTKFTRIGNHYINNNIEIANFDAMVHKQLQYLNDDVLKKNGGCHNEKVKRLYSYVSKKKHNDFIMMNNKKTDMILIDEFQDMDNHKVKIITQIIKYNKNIKAIAIGDYLQTIFEHSIQQDSLHPITLWKKELNTSYFEMNKCFRCPEPHLNFVNLIMQDFQKNLSISPIKHHHNKGYKPFLFYHPPTSYNQSSLIITNQIISIIKKHYEMNPNFHPKNVSILMSKANNNYVFRQLEFQLNKVYEQWGFKNKIKLFETKKDGIHQTINWSDAHGKTVLMSIHGYKGRENKIIIVPGVTQGSIPNENHLFKPKELIDYSLLNVALTRSSKYLYIGFTRTMMSIYIRKYFNLLSKYCILSWDKNTWDNENFLCNEINKHYHNILPIKRQKPWIHNFYKKEPIYRSDKLISSIKYDIALLYEHPNELCELDEPEIVEFGETIKYKENIDKDLAPIFGIMAETILEREYLIYNNKISCLKEEFSFFLNRNDIYYTKDERLLNIIYDESLNHKIKMDFINVGNYKKKWMDIKIKYKSYLKLNKDLNEEIDKILSFRKCKFIMPIIFKSNEFRHCVREFIDDKNVKPITYWNIALAKSVIYTNCRRPMLYMLINWYDYSLDGLIKNIRIFIKIIKNHDIIFHKKHNILCIEKDKKILKKMGFNDSVKYGVVGESDMISVDKKILFEIKCPISNIYHHQWTVQTLLYYCIPCDDNYKIKNICIVDLANGKYYRYKIKKINKKSVIKQILKKLEYLPCHIEELVSMIK